MDLFSPLAGGPAQVLDGVVTALRADGFDVQVLRGPDDGGGDFVQVAVTRDDRQVRVDLGRD